MSEEDIFPIFEPFGPLKDLAIIRDKHTGLHRGCAFVTYWASADGERAQEALHDNFTFPGGRRPAQVKPAEPSGTGELLQTVNIHNIIALMPLVNTTNALTFLSNTQFLKINSLLVCYRERLAKRKFEKFLRLLER